MASKSNLVLKIILKSLVILAALALFGWTAWQNLVPSGVFEATYAFSKPNPFVTPLSPGDRVGPIERDQSGTTLQALIDDPVYFRIRAPRSFEHARISVEFRNQSEQPFALGGLMSWEAFQFDLEPLEPSYAYGDWRIAHAEFDLTQLLAPDGRTYTFAFSLPSIHELGGQVEVRSIHATLERPPETFRSLLISLRQKFQGL